MKFLSFIKKFLPWLIALLLFVYLFYQNPPAQVWKAFGYVRLWIFVPYTIAYFLGILFLDSYSLAKVLSKFCIPISLREILPARSVSYLLSLVNYNAGQVALALYLKRSKQASFFKALGSLLFVLLIDLYWVTTFAFIGSFFIPLNLGPIHVNSWVQKISFLLFLGFFLHLSFWRSWFSRLFKFHVRFRFSDWIRGKHLFQTFHEARSLDYLHIAFLRLPMHLMIIASLYVAIVSFQASVSFFTVITTVPVILMIGVVPLTPGGLGTVQAATVEFLKNEITSSLFVSGDITPEQLLFAISLAWMFANYLLKSLWGLFYMKRMQADLFKEE